MSKAQQCMALDGLDFLCNDVQDTYDVPTIDRGGSSVAASPSRRRRCPIRTAEAFQGCSREGQLQRSQSPSSSSDTKCRWGRGHWWCQSCFHCKVWVFFSESCLSSLFWIMKSGGNFLHLTFSELLEVIQIFTLQPAAHLSTKIQ